MDASLEQLNHDLDNLNQSREGVVIDIRNNDGGNVNPYALDVFSRKGYLSLTPRGLPTAPGRRFLGQRALERPTVLLTNESTLSDGEDFTEGYRALKLGKVVGQPTAGWILFTDSVKLVDGTKLRLPFIDVHDSRGERMEGNPRPVDVPVRRRRGPGPAARDCRGRVAGAVRDFPAESLRQAQPRK